ncbi:sigma-70 family RNA polymerase sigma factor [Treponema sp. UBA3813]|uniref:RNA polymerase sigma factor n=1 Tax=Treponema sp. UBA3813 TaxID=1947715 RepID=UPI0025D17715|nr:sigma-70 family RNA polymerase sigma factor [Treponema sp. UBA3813]
MTLEALIIKKRDNALIKATVSGDSQAFSKLISFYKKRVRALGMSFFKNEADTDDFMQEVFIKAYTNLSKFRGESSFSTWLTSIAYNTAVNAKNRRKEYLPISDEENIEDQNLTPEKNQIRKMTVLAVREAVKDLPEKFALCVELYFFYDNSHAEISEITGLPVNTIKSHIFRAKKILREKLRGYYE